MLSTQTGTHPAVRWVALSIICCTLLFLLVNGRGFPNQLYKEPLRSSFSPEDNKVTTKPKLTNENTTVQPAKSMATSSYDSAPLREEIKPKLTNENTTIQPAKSMATSSYDYAPFREEIKLVIQQPVVPMTVSSTPLHCHFPSNAVMFTYGSHYMVDFLRLQQRSMNASGMGECLRSRLVTVCTDVKCREFCHSHGVQHCVLIDMGMLPPSDFVKGEYRFFTFLKHILMNEALKVAEYVFFFDADCLVMKNPFPETQFDREESGKHKLPTKPFDLLFQRDRGRGNACSGTVNTGQIYLRKSAGVEAYLQQMLSLETTILEGQNGLDQDFVMDVAMKSNLTNCVLTPHLYTSHCYNVFGNIAFILGYTPLNEIITYHVSCEVGAKSKHSSLLNVLTAMEHHKTDAMSHFMRH